MSTDFKSLVETDVDLKPYNTLNISARARYFATIESESQLKEVLRHPKTEGLKIMVLGGGSNVLFADDFDGLILHIEIKGREVVKENDEYVWLKIGAGENWHQAVRYCVEKGWGGIENLSLIPGTVGAAPIQNIGAYGVELEEVFEWLEAVDIEGRETRRYEKGDCNFGYRDSIFKGELKGVVIVTNVVLKLSKNPELNTSYGAIQSEIEKRNIDELTIRDISDIVIDIRNSKLPNPDLLGNAGSFFKNSIVENDVFERIKMEYPEAPGYEMGDQKMKVPAGWLIEEAGWKGKVVGNTGTYKQQALVIVNHGGATGGEILNLADQIKESVEEQFGIALVPEVNIVSSDGKV
ncbi:UDP-N-acetylenolpyruvoylglucosamine reductase [Aliifodinibius salipaludis]|uniref:UDP-N-acetylenolpyruvoylglucosamine reductase n=1 Tax=Fodinibius salipaludis TaxID=2032627 RepID=A0A2A2GFR3_9BACT|nr:UDP-N-acetylmuramate dehydrogenase [Aliifodinibius salipaludis]PAU95729.1 UDP-N-acetylenolpyruvoylglucosamine reductase [Aliifodinibius salipaludis]